MTRLRLLKVLVQPVFVVDDGDSLTERPGNPVEVPASQWRAFGAGSFSPEDIAALQAQIDALEQPVTTSDDDFYQPAEAE